MKNNNDGSYRAMIEEIEDYAILLLDVNGIVMNWNKGAEKIKGYKPNEIIGKSFKLFYSKEDCLNNHPEKLIEKASLHGKANEEGWRIRKDGTHFWGSILITAIHDENGKVIGFSKVTRDLTERRNAEEIEKHLVKTREGLLIIFNASPSGMALTDIESRKFVEVNKTFQSIFGFKREEVIGSDAIELGIVSNSSRIRLSDNLKLHGFLKDEDIVCFTKDKKEINCILSLDEFEMEGKKYFLSVFQDISQIKAIERKVKESEEKFHKAFQSSAAGISITRLSDSTYLEVNNTFLDLTGYSRQELIGHTSLELGIIEDSGKRDEVLKEIRTHGSAKHFELAIRNKSGAILNIISSVETILINDDNYAINTIYDITERKKTEEQLGHLAAIIEYSDDAIISKSIDGTITSWNGGAEKLLGYTAEQAIGKNISFIVPTEYLKEEKNILERICRNEVIDHYETVRLKMNGEQFHVSITASPLKNMKGDIIAISKSIRDISARKKSEDSGRLKDAFLSIISHEIRTPLNAIMGFSDVLLKRKLGEPEKEFVGIIKSAGENLLTIVNDTIDMSKIETGTITFEEDDFSVSEIFQTINKSLIKKAKAKSIALFFSCDRTVPEVLRGDRKRLAQIITCLTNNAIAFTEIGEINVHASVFNSDNENALLVFSVTDTGIGISVNKLRTIFDRFRQVENHNNRKQGGLGLGLNISKGLIELQGGTLSVESELNKGSVFSFKIPYKKVDTPKLLQLLQP